MTLRARDLWHYGLAAALLASTLLNLPSAVLAQETQNARSLQLGPRQPPPKKWYSRLMPWKKSAASGKYKAPPQRQVTNVDEPSEATKTDGQLSLARLSERRGNEEQAKFVFQDIRVSSN